MGKNGETPFAAAPQSCSLEPTRGCCIIRTSLTLSTEALGLSGTAKSRAAAAAATPAYPPAALRRMFLSASRRFPDAQGDCQPYQGQRPAEAAMVLPGKPGPQSVSCWRAAAMLNVQAS